MDQPGILLSKNMRHGSPMAPFIGYMRYSSPLQMRIIRCVTTMKAKQKMPMWDLHHPHFKSTPCIIQNAPHTLSLRCKRFLVKAFNWLYSFIFSNITVFLKTHYPVALRKGNNTAQPSLQQSESKSWARKYNQQNLLLKYPCTQDLYLLLGFLTESDLLIWTWSYSCRTIFKMCTLYLFNISLRGISLGCHMSQVSA